MCVYNGMAENSNLIRKMSEAVTESILGNKYHLLSWAHRLSGLESEQTVGDSEGQRSLAGCCP